ncbi:MAG: hypothetical protein JWM98_1354 [Thermoleophilia bacterium]|nr:hypothetical protein [Thermoleophilia bacterium]
MTVGWGIPRSVPDCARNCRDATHRSTTIADPHHLPAPDAPASEWEPYLRGRGYLRDSKPQPFSSYRSFHGFWVPPRLAPVDHDEDAPAARVRKAPKPKEEDPAVVQARADRARLAEHRALVEGSVEAGLMNQAEAERRIAAWAEAQGIPVPE